MRSKLTSVGLFCAAILLSVSPRLTVTEPVATLFVLGTLADGLTGADAAAIGFSSGF